MIMSNPGFFFLLPAFCDIWAIFWNLLPQVSILLVGILSVSRLLILKYPTYKLSPPVAVLLPYMSLLILLLISVGLVSGKIMFSSYFPTLLQVGFITFKHTSAPPQSY